MKLQNAKQAILILAPLMPLLMSTSCSFDGNIWGSSDPKEESLQDRLSWSSIETIALEGAITPDFASNRMASTIHIYDATGTTHETLGSGDYFEYSSPGFFAKTQSDITLGTKPWDTLRVRFIVSDTLIAYDGWIIMRDRIRIAQNTIDSNHNYTLEWDPFANDSIKVISTIGILDSSRTFVGNTYISKIVTSNSVQRDLKSLFSDSLSGKPAYAKIETWIWYKRKFSNRVNRLYRANIAQGITIRDTAIIPIH